MREVARLKSQLAETLREYSRSENGNRTRLLRRAAEITVQLRACFDYDGRPDYRGRTYAYRSAMSEAFGEAGITPSETKRVRDALAWHVGEALRETLSPAEVADLGLRDARPKDRAAERHDRERTVLNASVPKRYDSSLKILAGAAAAVAAVKADAVDKLSQDELKELARRAGELRRQADRVERLALRRLE